jgi:predicted DNA repair protein MutK
VAGIVKLDDLGWHLQRRTSAGSRALGSALLALAPKLMRTLSVVGTAAMFMVGGGILLHGWPALGHAVEVWSSGWGQVFGGLAQTAVGAAVGVAAGAVVLGVVSVVQRWRR